MNRSIGAWLVAGTRPPPSAKHLSRAAAPARGRFRSGGGADALRTFGRHQVGALVSTVVDFGAMIACVEWFGVPVVAGTAMGATLGAATNFTLGRAWVFRRCLGHPAGQAVRYAVVSAASAGWNSLGVHLGHDLAHIQYIVARIVAAVAVGLLWNFPMHSGFVFRSS
jgi:putative flippase GtrA